jgi:tRNA threonylcarbamoyladenosine modification (KEOPS) complex  Pcc1 subunit
MAKNKTINTSYDVSYSARDEDHNTIRDIRINFENPDVSDLCENLNTWLRAINVPLVVTNSEVSQKG